MLFGPCTTETMLVDEMKSQILVRTQASVTQRVRAHERPAASLQMGVDVLPKRVVATPRLKAPSCQLSLSQTERTVSWTYESVAIGDCSALFRSQSSEVRLVVTLPLL